MALGAAGCGSKESTDAFGEPLGTFPVTVVSSSFPKRQQLAQSTIMRVAVRNEGRRRIPDLAVTIEGKGKGTQARAFSESDPSPNLADSSRPVWIVDQGPATSGVLERPGRGQPNTTFANTWALGSLAPGRTAVFVWRLTAVKPGRHSVVFKVAAGLNGKAVACQAGDCARTARRVGGGFNVFIDPRPDHPRVGRNGQVIGGAPPLRHPPPSQGQGNGSGVGSGE